MVEIDRKLYNDIKLYCKTNDLVIKDFINKLLRKAFTIEKYGERPFVESKPNVIEMSLVETKPTTIGNNTDKLADSHFVKHEVNPTDYGEIYTTDKVELSNNYPHNNIIETPFIAESINIKKVNKEEKIEEPKKERRNKKRTL